MISPTVLPVSELVVKGSGYRVRRMDRDHKFQNQAISVLTDAKGLDEDWTGLSGLANRRKLQNRLNRGASHKGFLLYRYSIQLID